MGKMQRQKGANAEREVAKILNEHGVPARRGQVFNDQPDVVTDLPIHIEVKRQEKLKIMEWFQQSEKAAKEEGRIPTVVFRRSREPWMITLKLGDFLYLLKGENANGTKFKSTAERNEADSR